MTAVFEEIDADECRRLLATQMVGRFAVNRAGQGPFVVPVNFTVDDQGIISFRTGFGTKLMRATRGAVTFQVDEIDPFHHTGWSVLVEGIAHELDADEAGVDVEPWAPGAKDRAVRIVPTRITGRRIRLQQPDTDARGYR